MTKYKRKIEDLQEKAKERGGICLSSKWIGIDKKYQFDCQNGCPPFWATASNVFNNKWCPRCAGKNMTIEDMQILADKWNGKCLSTEYLGAYKNHLWECAMKHQFLATPSNVRNHGSWCQTCGKFFNIGEEMSRVVMEFIFRVRFFRQRPKWNRSTLTNYPLELDGLSNNLPQCPVAFEYNGLHHQGLHTLFTETRTLLNKKQQNDRDKKRNCKKAGVILIVFSEIKAFKGILSEKAVVDNVYRHLEKKRGQLLKHGIILADKPDVDQIDFSLVYISFMNHLKKRAKNKHCRILSDKYRGHDKELELCCDHGHLFRATPRGIDYRKYPCKECRKDTVWDSQYKKLESFYHKDKHTDLSRVNGKDWVALRHWCWKQRKAIKNDELPTEKRQLLDRIGFPLEPDNKSSLLRESRLNQLIEHKNVYGHLNVNMNDEKFKGLWRWCSNQRAQRKAGILSDESIQELSALGFIWDCDHAHRLDMQQRLREFGEREGHLDVPARYPEDQELAHYVTTRRRAYRKGELFVDEIDELIEMGFIFNPVLERWFENYSQLVKFSRRYGNCRVPRYWKENASLGTWVADQRKKWKPNGKTGRLHVWQIELLEKIGFEENPGVVNQTGLIEKNKKKRKKRLPTQIASATRTPYSFIKPEFLKDHFFSDT